MGVIQNFINRILGKEEQIVKFEPKHKDEAIPLTPLTERNIIDEDDYSLQVKQVLKEWTSENENKVDRWNTLNEHFKIEKTGYSLEEVEKRFGTFQNHISKEKLNYLTDDENYPRIIETIKKDWDDRSISILENGITEDDRWLYGLDYFLNEFPNDLLERSPEEQKDYVLAICGRDEFFPDGLSKEDIIEVINANISYHESILGTANVPQCLRGLSKEYLSMDLETHFNKNDLDYARVMSGEFKVTADMAKNAMESFIDYRFQTDTDYEVNIYGYTERYQYELFPKMKSPINHFSPELLTPKEWHDLSVKEINLIELLPEVITENKEFWNNYEDFVGKESKKNVFTRMPEEIRKDRNISWNLFQKGVVNSYFVPDQFHSDIFLVQDGAQNKILSISLDTQTPLDEFEKKYLTNLSPSESRDYLEFLQLRGAFLKEILTDKDFSQQINYIKQEDINDWKIVTKIFHAHEQNITSFPDYEFKKAVTDGNYEKLSSLQQEGYKPSNEIINDLTLTSQQEVVIEKIFGIQTSIEKGISLSEVNNETGPKHELSNLPDTNKIDYTSLPF